MSALTAALTAPTRTTTGRGAIPAVWRGTIVETYSDGTVAALLPSLLGDQAVRMPCAIATPSRGDHVIVGAVEGRSGDFIVIGSETKPAASKVHRHPWSDLDNVPATFAPIIGTTGTTAKAGNYVPAWGEITSKPTTFVPAAHTHVALDISDSTALGRTLMKVADMAAARTAIGAGTSSLVIGTGSTNAMAGDKTFTKTDVGLSNVDNTTDANKPVSAATLTALNLKAPLASPAFTGTPTGITKTHVGLSNVDNTTDAAKPVSTATQTALNLKADLTDLRVTILPSPKLVGDAPSTYVLGWTSFSVSGAVGWPAGTGTVLTFRHGGLRALQQFIEKNSGRIWSRVESDGDVFSAFVESATTAPATSSAAGLMSAADKTRLDAGTSLNTPSTLAYRDVNGQFSVSTPTQTGHVTRKDYVDGKKWAGEDITSGTISPLRVANATAALDGLMPKTDKAKLDAATSAPTASTVAMRNSAGRIQVTSPGTDTTAATPKSYVDALTDARAGDGHQYRFLAGVIRNDGSAGGYWQLLPEATNHRPINIDSIVSYDNKIRVQYTALGAGMTIAFFAQPDETLAQEGIIMGTSVTPTYTDIKISQVARGVSDYISYNGTTWVSQDGIFTGISFSAGTLTLNHAAIPLNSQYAVNITPRGGNYTYPVSGGSSPTGSTQVKIEVRDLAGAIVTTPTTNMRFYLSRGGGTRDINPLLMDTTAYPLSNIWLWGIMGMD